MFSAEDIGTQIQFLINGAEEHTHDSVAFLAGRIEEAVKDPNFKQISLNNAKLIIDQAGKISVETAELILSEFKETYGKDAAVLLAYFDCGDSGSKSIEVLRPFQDSNLIKEIISLADRVIAVEAFAEEISSLRRQLSIMTQFRSYYEEEKLRNRQLQSKIRILQNGSNSEIADDKIFVKTLTGKHLSFQFDPQQTVRQLKGAIQGREGIPPDQQRLIFGGIEMSDELQLTEYGVGPSSLLILILHLRG